MRQFISDRDTRKWLIQVLIVVLVFALLAWGIWLVYIFNIREAGKVSTTYSYL